jgi:hypothetical protein
LLKLQQSDRLKLASSSLANLSVRVFLDVVQKLSQIMHGGIATIIKKFNDRITMVDVKAENPMLSVCAYKKIVQAIGANCALSHLQQYNFVAPGTGVDYSAVATDAQDLICCTSNIIIDLHNALISSQVIFPTHCFVGSGSHNCSHCWRMLLQHENND